MKSPPSTPLRFESPPGFPSGLITGAMVTLNKLSAGKSESPKALAAVARQQLLLINGLLDEVSRNYLGRLHREINELVRSLEKGRARPDKQTKALRDMLKRIAHLHINPEKGRRKDLKKIDELIGELQSIVERW